MLRRRLSGRQLIWTTVGLACVATLLSVHLFAPHAEANALALGEQPRFQITAATAASLQSRLRIPAGFARTTRYAGWGCLNSEPSVYYVACFHSSGAVALDERVMERLLARFGVTFEPGALTVPPVCNRPRKYRRYPGITLVTCQFIGWFDGAGIHGSAVSIFPINPAPRRPSRPSLPGFGSGMSISLIDHGTCIEWCGSHA